MFRIEISHKSEFPTIDLVFENERLDLAERVAESHRKAGSKVTVTPVK